MSSGRRRVKLAIAAGLGVGAAALYTLLLRRRALLLLGFDEAGSDQSEEPTPLDGAAASSAADDDDHGDPQDEDDADSPYVPFALDDSRPPPSTPPAVQLGDPLDPRLGDTPEWLRESAQLVQALPSAHRQPLGSSGRMRAVGIFARSVAAIQTGCRQRRAGAARSEPGWGAAEPWADEPAGLGRTETAVTSTSFAGTASATDSDSGRRTRLINADGSDGAALIALDVSLNVLSLFAIDTVEQRFSCEFVLRCRTLNASRLRTEAGEHVSHDNFEPRIRIVNLIAVERWRMRPSACKVEGELEFKYTIAGTLAEPFQLSLFPWDVQTLTITLSSAIPYQNLRFHARDTVRWSPWPAVAAPWAVVPETSRFSESNVYALSRVSASFRVTSWESG